MGLSTDAPPETPVAILLSPLLKSAIVVSNPGKDFPTIRRNLAAVSNNSYGYFAGGNNGHSTISRLDFSNETVSNPGKNLNPARDAASAVFNNSYGYFGGGSTPVNINTITRLDFSNETVSDPGKNLPIARDSPSGVSNNSYGYFGGGNVVVAGPGSTNTIARLDFSNETLFILTNNLPTPNASSMTALTNSN